MDAAARGACALLCARAVGYCAPMPPGRWATLVLLLLPASAGVVLSLAPVPGRILLAAVVPALGWSLVLLAVTRRPLGPSITMLLWGSGVAAPLALVVNDLLGGNAGGELVAVLAAPLVEETAKAAGLVALLLLLPGEIRNARDGIHYGTLVGLGFAAVENASYLTIAAVQGGLEGLLSGLYLRGLVEGLNHAVFTGAIGAGLGWAAQQTGRVRWTPPLLGFAAGVGQHVLWNAVASQAITASLCAAELPGGACADVPPSSALFLTAPLIAAACLGPGGLALLAVARRRQ